MPRLSNLAALSAALAAGACCTDGVPRGVRRGLAAAGDAPPLVELEARGDVVWILPVALERWPIDARRAALAVAPDGETLLAGAAWRGRERTWRLVKGYAERGLRSVEVDDRGRVLRRSHTLPLEDAPAEVRAAIDHRSAHATLEHLEVLLDASPHARYRATWAIEGEPPYAIEFDRRGRIRRTTTLREAILAVDV